MILRATHGIALVPELNREFTSDGALGQALIVDLKTLKITGRGEGRVVENVKTKFGAKTMGLDPKTHNPYLTTSDFVPAPPKTEKQPNPQPAAMPETFRVLIYGR